MSPPTSSKTTLRDLRRRANNKTPFAVLTCYDATTARWLARGGLDALLVGDTAGSVVLGFEDTVHVGLDFLLTLTAAVRRGAPDAFVMGDMPFMSYQADDAEGVRNAGRFLTEGHADAVKLEVDHRHVGLVAKLDRANVPVVAHIGWGPQRTGRFGVPVVAGRTDAKIEEMAKLARELERAGAAVLLVEQATAESAAAVVEAVSIPVIGCGAGPSVTPEKPGVHGQVVVLHDLLGLTDRQPSFVKPIARGGEALADAARRWVEAVGSGEVLKDGGPYERRG